MDLRHRKWFVVQISSCYLLATLGIFADAQVILRGGVRLQVPPQFLGGGINGEPIQLTPALVETIGSTAQSRLRHVDALIADQQWDEAIDTLLDLLREPELGLVEVADDRFVPLREHCHRLVSEMPAEGLTRYRARVDPVAQEWFERGVAERDRPLLARIVRDVFCSSVGDEALLALGELALEAGEYDLARSYWLQISPLVRSPAGRPVWLALADLDLDQHADRIGQIWHRRDAPPDWLAYPDTDIDLATVRARLALASIRAERATMAATELDSLRVFHPRATGRLGGVEKQLVAGLEVLFDGMTQWPAIRAPRDWPTFAGQVSRDSQVASPPRATGLAWPIAVRLAPSVSVTSPQGVRDRAQPPLRYHPVVINDRVVVASSYRVRAFQLRSGEPWLQADGELYAVRRSNAPDFRPRLARRIVAGTAHYTLASHHDVVYARLGNPVTALGNVGGDAAAGDAQQELVGLDLARDGLLSFKAEPEDANWAFEGAPVCLRGRLYVAMRHSDVKPRTYIACYDIDTSRQLWRTPICAADTRASGRGSEITNGLLTLAADTIFYNTNLGAVAAVDPEGGNVRWLRRYDRAKVSAGRQVPTHFQREPSPAVFAAGVLVCAPSDTPALFALDATTGKMLWTTHRAAAATHLLGVAEGAVVATGSQCWSFDLATGRQNFVWPASPVAGMRGAGRGCLAGQQIYWPTRDGIYVLSAQHGGQLQPAIDLSATGAEGANLIVAGDMIVCATADRLFALGPASPRKTNSRPPMRT